LVSTAFAQPPKITPTAEEQKTIEAIEKAGGKAQLDPKLSANARVAVKFDAATDATLLALKKFPLVGSVDVYDANKCTEKGLGALKELPHLRRLILSQSGMTPPRVTAIAQCKEIRDLRLPNSGLSDSELAVLKKLAFLESLDISENAQITDKGMTTVKTFERLQALYLMKTSITDKGLFELKPLEGLRSLNVGGTKVTATAAEKFADDMPNLRVVRQ
jgi:hypothetical protein